MAGCAGGCAGGCAAGMQALPDCGTALGSGGRLRDSLSPTESSHPAPHRHHRPLGMGAADLPGCTTASSHLVNTEEQRRMCSCTPGSLSSSALPLPAQHDAMCMEGSGEGRQPRPGPQVDTSDREAAGGRLGLMRKDEEREGPSARRNQERLPGRGGI